MNPLRYRGYYDDSESELYYLQSRYYDPELGRFINADNYISTGWGLLGYNTFAYCNNSPIVMVDSCGWSPEMVDDDLNNRPDPTEQEDGGPTGVSSNGPSTPGNAPNGGSGGNANSSSAITYTPKVNTQMSNSADLYHAFPAGVDKYIAYGQVSCLLGGDGVERMRIHLRGSINGINGVYEYIFEPNGVCNHRLFRPC